MHFVDDKFRIIVCVYIFIININEDFKHNYYFDNYYMVTLIKARTKAFNKITINPFIYNNVLTILITIYLY